MKTRLAYNGVCSSPLLNQRVQAGSTADAASGSFTTEAAQPESGAPKGQTDACLLPVLLTVSCLQSLNRKESHLSAPGHGSHRELGWNGKMPISKSSRCLPESEAIRWSGEGRAGSGVSMCPATWGVAPGPWLRPIGGNPPAGGSAHNPGIKTGALSPPRKRASTH